ncbi:Ig-like domain-containing protein [Pyxidicoccus sp. 3LFB2]
MSWMVLALLTACGPGVEKDPGADGAPDSGSGNPTAFKPPRGVLASPEDGASGIAAVTSLRFTFSEPMDRDATPQAFVIHEPAGVSGSLSWASEDRVFTFKPTSPLPAGATVRWEFTTTAKSAAGLALEQPFTGSFSVGVPPADGTWPTVVSASPGDGASGLPVGQVLRVTFSEPMDKPATEAAFFVEGVADTAGTFAWTGNTLDFTPSAPWPDARPVTWGVSAGAKDVGGAGLAESLSRTFSVSSADTKRPFLVEMPIPVATGVAPSFSLTLGFSEAMDQASVERAFTVYSCKDAFSQQQVPGSFTWNELGDKVTFLAASAAPYGAYIAYDVAEDAKDLAGNPMGGGDGPSRPEVSCFNSPVLRIIQRYQVKLERRFELSGSLVHNLKSGTTRVSSNTDVLRVGDDLESPAGSGVPRYRGYLGFDLSSLQPRPQRIVSAQLEVERWTTQGSPFGVLGSLDVAPVDFGPTLEAADWTLPVGPAQMLARDATADVNTVDVTTSVAARWDSRETSGPRAQFRIAFDENVAAQPGNLVDYYNSGSWVTPELILEYEAP